ncbi:MAG: exopolysaccharide biosynthesis protein [Alphaproteobacteria bacterium]|nr:exopolysaccharide biosynthesis protein [Alphaproteobacteria bacterium]
MHFKKHKVIPKRSSEILMKFIENKNLNGDLTYQHILHTLGNRAFGIVILFFALPSILPFSVIPGVAVVFSFPIVILAFEMILGRKSIWLPKRIAQKTISHTRITEIISAVIPYVLQLERLAKPRLTFMTYHLMKIINGITILFLACLLMLPIPFSNFIFGALLAIFSMGMIEKDGFLISIGYLCFIVYLSFIYVLALHAIEALLFIKNLSS